MKYILIVYCILQITCASVNGKDELLLSDFDRRLELGSSISSYLTSGFSVRATMSLEEGQVVLNGPFSVYTKDGTVVLQGSYVRGRLHGELLNFAPEGWLMLRMTYRNGLVVGDKIRWNEKGDVRQVVPFNETGEKDGIERYFDNREIETEIVWSVGELVEVREFSDGEVRKVIRGDDILDWVRGNLRPPVDASGY